MTDGEECLRRGMIVTFSFEAHSRRELPVNPKIMRIRQDLSWDDIMKDDFVAQSILNGTKSILAPILTFTRDI